MKKSLTNFTTEKWNIHKIVNYALNIIKNKNVASPHKSAAIGQSSKVSKSWQKIFICASSCLSITSSLFPMDIKGHFLSDLSSPCSPKSPCTLFFLSSNRFLSLSSLCFDPCSQSPNKLREREQASIFWGKRWRKIVLPSLASMKIISSTNQVLSRWYGFSSLYNSCYYAMKISFSFACIPKLNMEQLYYPGCTLSRSQKWGGYMRRGSIRKLYFS